MKYFLVIASKWKDALHLTSIKLETLQEGSYVVCTRHFKETDYRNSYSNCLNSTAVPSLEENINERIQTTKGKRKSELTEIKCHKIVTPETPSNKRKQVLTKEFILKKVKLNVPIAIEKDATIISNEVIKPIEKPPIIEAPYEDIKEINTDATFEEIHEDHHDSEILLEPEEANIIEQADKNTQTDEEKKIEPLHKEDKEEKIISLLYPKYSGLTKIELVKMLMERDLKISSLEEKEKQLENALKNLI